MLEGLVALVSSCCSFLVCLFSDFWDFLELLVLAPKYDLFWWARWGAKGRGWVGPWFHQHRICPTTPLHFFLSLSLTWRQVSIPHLSKTTTHLKNDGVWVSRMIDVATGDKCNLAILDFQLEEQIIRWHCTALKRKKTSTGLSLQLLRNYDVCALQETGRGVPDCPAVKQTGGIRACHSVKGGGWRQVASSPPPWLTLAHTTRPKLWALMWTGGEGCNEFWTPTENLPQY